MKKRIYLNMLFLTFISVALVAVLLTLSFYMGFDNQVKSELKNKAVLLEKILNQNENNADYLTKLGLSGGDVRITIIAAGGEVSYDNVTTPSKMENHSAREEIIEAYTGGTGESSRVSTTLGEKTYYYSRKLADGSVLRVSKTTSSIYGVFTQSLPITILIIILILLLSHFLAQSLTKKITKPINGIDLNTTECVYDELSPLVRTITHQKQQIKNQYADLEQRTKTTTAIMENMQEGILLLDKSSTILSLNHSAAELLSTSDTAVGKNIIEITRNTDIIEGVKSALNGIRSSITVNPLSKTYTVFFSPVSGGGAIVLFLDVTDRTNAEKMRREFSANVSHELKTPLTSISGYAEMLAGGLVKEEDTASFANKIKDESARLINLIEDIISLSELDEANRLKSFEIVDLSEIAKEVVGSLQRISDESDTLIKTDMEKVRACVDRQMMSQLIYNLVDNAIKYNKPNGIVNVTIKFDDGNAKIIVSDSGIGIPKKHIDRIFERFYRVDKSHSKKTGGTGLGLSIVKHIVLYHGGEIKVTSEENKGTTITVIVESISNPQ